MGKLKDLAMVKTANSDSFVYTPPDAAFGAGLILVKPNLAYPKKHPATVSMPVLGAVLRGLRRASPSARIVVAEGVTSDRNALDIFEELGVGELLDAEMRVGDVDQLLMENYRNTSPEPVKYKTMRAPGYIRSYDCVITVGTFKRVLLDGKPHISASTKNLFGLFPREHYGGADKNSREQLHEPSVPEVLKDVYFSIGHFFHGAVVDLTEKYVSPDARTERDNVSEPVGKVVWGDDMLAVDETACKLVGEDVPEYIHDIRRLKKMLQK